MSKGTNDKTEIKTVKLVRQIGTDLDWNKKENRQLLAAFLALKTEDEAKRFLRDLMTTQEIKEFANRLSAADFLASDMQYNFISERTGLSSATIARIAKWLGGTLGGYRLVLNRLHHKNSSSFGKGLSLRN
jgi:TrpR-related protein YerC/YecD